MSYAGLCVLALAPGISYRCHVLQSIRAGKFALRLHAELQLIPAGTFSEYGSSLKTSGAMYMRLPVRPVSLNVDSSSVTKDRS